MTRKISDEKLANQYASHLRTSIGLTKEEAHKEAKRAITSQGPLGRGYALRQTQHKRKKSNPNPFEDFLRGFG